MLRNFPIFVGVTLCEDVVPDSPANRISVIRAFSGIRKDRFPAVALPFCAFATFTDGQGEGEIAVTVSRIAEELDVVYQVRQRIRFEDPLQTVYYIQRLSRSPLPLPPASLVRLWLEGVCAGQRSLRVYQSGAVS